MDPGPGWTILATSRAVQARTGKSLRAAIRQLPPLRSAIITANGATATIPPALDHATTRLLSTLTNPEPRHQDEYANSGRKTSPPTPTPTRQPRPDHRPPHRYTLNCEEPNYLTSTSDTPLSLHGSEPVEETGAQLFLGGLDVLPVGPPSVVGNADSDEHRIDGDDATHICESGYIDDGAFDGCHRRAADLCDVLGRHRRGAMVAHHGMDRSAFLSCRETSRLARRGRRQAVGCPETLRSAAAGLR